MTQEQQKDLNNLLLKKQQFTNKVLEYINTDIDKAIFFINLDSGINNKINYLLEDLKPKDDLAPEIPETPDIDNKEQI